MLSDIYIVWSHKVRVSLITNNFDSAVFSLVWLLTAQGNAGLHWDCAGPELTDYSALTMN